MTDWKKIAKDVKKLGGIEEIEVKSGDTWIKLRFFKEDLVENTRKPYTKRGNSKKSEEILEKIKQQDEVNEMSILDPLAYEEQLALGSLVEDE